MVFSLKLSQSLIATFFFVLAALTSHQNTSAALLQLTWADNSHDENGFDIERRVEASGEFWLLATLPANQNSYTDTNLANGTTYCYRVRAFNSIGGSPYSNQACATTPVSASVSELSTNTISTNIDDGAVLRGSDVIWTAVPSGTPVRVEFFIDNALRTTELSSPYRFAGDSGTLDTTTLADGSHQLRVRALYPDSSVAEQTVDVTVDNIKGNAYGRT